MTFPRQLALLLPSAFLLGALCFLLTHGRGDPGFAAHPFLERLLGPSAAKATPEIRYLAQSGLIFLPAYAAALLFVWGVRVAEGALFGRVATRAPGAYRRSFEAVFPLLYLAASAALLLWADRAMARLAPEALVAPALTALAPFAAGAVALPAGGAPRGAAGAAEPGGGGVSAPSRPIVVLDFGSQYTQLIARRIREARVFSVVLPGTASEEQIRKWNPAGLVLSGGPRSVYEPGAPLPAADPLAFAVPALGVCYGMQWMAHAWGGKLSADASGREYGRADGARRAGLGALRRTRARADRLDEPRRLDLRAAPGVPGDRLDARQPDRRFREPGSAALRPAVPSRGPPHRARGGDPRELPLPDLRRAPRLDDGFLPRREGRGDPRPGPRRSGDLRPVGRGRLLGHGDPPARGSRRPRPPDPRGPRPHAGARAAGGGRRLPAARHRDPRRGRFGPLSVAARGRGRSRGEAPHHRAHVHRGLRAGGALDPRGEVPRAGDALPGRDRIGLDPGPLRRHQDASQRRRTPREARPRADRAGSRALQGRGAASSAPSSGSRRSS